MGDRLSYAWLKVKGEVCFWLVRWLPLPEPESPRFDPICRLWGEAYMAGEVHSFDDWRDYWLPVHFGKRVP